MDANYKKAPAKVLKPDDDNEEHCKVRSNAPSDISALTPRMTTTKLQPFYFATSLY